MKKKFNGNFLDHHFNSRKSKLCLIGFACFSFIGYMVSGTTDYASDYNEIKDSYETLKTSYTELQDVNSELESENQELKVTIEGLKTELDSLEKDVESQPTEQEINDTNVTEIEEVVDQPTLSQQNAIRSAESYLNYSSFSRKGLIEQLEYEGYSNDDATYAVDNVFVDWNEQCAKTAQSYLNYSSFSRSGLYDQLEYEGFTSTQIEYGLAAVGY